MATESMRWQVVLASRHQPKFARNQDVQWTHVDIVDPNSINEAVKGADTVVNLVGIMDEHPPKYTFANVQHLVCEGGQAIKIISFI
jgi:uncharacterized protein YbjT (DUF2867 family)